MVYDTAHMLALVTLLQKHWSSFRITHLQLPFFSAAPGSIEMTTACYQLKRVADLLASVYPGQAVMVDGHVPPEIAAVLDNGLLIIDGILYISGGLEICSDAVRDGIPSLPPAFRCATGSNITTLSLTIPALERGCDYSRLKLTGVKSLVLILDVWMVSWFLRTVVAPHLLHLHFAVSVESIVKDHPHTDLTECVGNAYPATYILRLLRKFYLKHRVESQIDLDVRFTGFASAVTSHMQPDIMWLQRQCDTFAKAVSSRHQEWVMDS
jgi:hypothetical protein